MSNKSRPADKPVDELLQALSLSPGLPLAADDVAVAPAEPEVNPNSLLARVLRSHPGLKPEEASEMLIAFGASPDDDVGAIHAWRRSGQPAYERIPLEPDTDA